ncbi:MAG: C10 family peptidase, partial [Bacteroidales bacterium]|nr:C10 family peptidase [Bacteroidales bacterium]
MKKSLLFLSAFLFFVGQMFANPVDVNTAKNLGAKYLRNNVLSAKDVADVELAYIFSGEDGTPYLYVFNHENGYVVVAADDCAHPILGYCEDTPFDANNIPDGVKYFLGHFGRQIQHAIDNDIVADEEIASQWDLLRKEGVIMKTRMEKSVEPLISTTWDQDWPYNYYAPACSSYWTNNHCYAGCVATAMSQVMKFWNWPVTGVGEHTYSTSSYGGTLSANFGATTYDWAIMPSSCSSPNAGAQAVALLMYHCAIAVDMDFSPNGSGAHTEDVAPAVINHFRYGSCTYVDARDSYSRTAWEDKLIAQLDRGFPMVYAGSDTDGGHAFDCDGYNNQRYFHFNLGWSGQGNIYYQIDAINTFNGNFNQYQRAVFEMVPDYVYDAMVPAIESLEVAIADAVTKTATVSFTVPTVSESGAALQTVEKIEIKRNGNVVKTFNNVQAGEELSYEDTVNEYGCYEYTIVAENNNTKGQPFSTVALFGPNCTWKLVCTTTNFQGWNGGKIQFVSSNGTVFKEIAMTTSSPFSEK